jgi:hypothetical protein
MAYTRDGLTDFFWIYDNHCSYIMDEYDPLNNIGTYKMCIKSAPYLH